MKNATVIEQFILTLDDVTSCCQAKGVPFGCMGHCITDYQKGNRKQQQEDRKVLDVGLCKDYIGMIEECQRKGIRETYLTVCILLIHSTYRNILSFHY